MSERKGWGQGSRQTKAQELRSCSLKSHPKRAKKGVFEWMLGTVGGPHVHQEG